MNSDEILVEEKKPKIKRKKGKQSSNQPLAFLIGVLVQDLLHPTAASEARKHKLKTLVQGPRSYFLDVKCPGCLNITTVFSHAQTAVTCESCSTVLCTPTGGKAKLSEGTSFRRK
ncbi:HN1_G0055050.mRNA.1.CDS.1 [Saccharomyces cerevisiae]|nr:HN1_G0055050.mRNA.1.CDS.1 [Saccharomyces cerevisiae]CAI4493597.1 BAL_1a_G0023200.mRNA.1.CDS.1 [Saccharomyces cerevisiae]CAI7144845.1 BAL_1a_G0023200.mRNA.1.CDS.1 [Saccharomyces cerevisiae]